MQAQAVVNDILFKKELNLPVQIIHIPDKKRVMFFLGDPSNNENGQYYILHQSTQKLIYTNQPRVVCIYQRNDQETLLGLYNGTIKVLKYLQNANPSSYTLSDPIKINDQIVGMVENCNNIFVLCQNGEIVILNSELQFSRKIIFKFPITHVFNSPNKAWIACEHNGRHKFEIIEKQKPYNEYVGLHISVEGMKFQGQDFDFEEKVYQISSNLKETLFGVAVRNQMIAIFKYNNQQLTLIYKVNAGTYPQLDTLGCFQFVRDDVLLYSYYKSQERRGFKHNFLGLQKFKIFIDRKPKEKIVTNLKYENGKFCFSQQNENNSQENGIRVYRENKILQNLNHIDMNNQK